MMQRNNRSAAMIQSMVQNNPRAKQFLHMFRGKTEHEKEQMVRNMCKERGISIEQLAQSLGVTIPR